MLMRRSSVGRAPTVRRVYPNADPDFARNVLAVQTGAQSAAANPENKAALWLPPQTRSASSWTATCGQSVSLQRTNI